MAGSSMTFTYDDGSDLAGAHRGIRKVTASWISDDSTGAVSGTTGKIVGEIIKAVTVPSGTAAPTANYDITLADEAGVDILAACVAAGRLADRHTSTTEQRYFFAEDIDTAPLAKATHPAVCDKITIAVTNAGNSKAGTIILYIR